MLAVALAANASPPLPLPTYRVDPVLTDATFAVSQFGVLKQRGRFERMSGTIVLDPAGGGGSIDFILDGTSVSTGWELRDDFLRGATMFDVERFPTVRFRSQKLVYDVASLTGVDGEVTLRGITQPLHLDVRQMRCGATLAHGHEGCRAHVVGRLSRTAFGMDFAYPLIGDEVQLDFALTAFRVRDEGETASP
jgi:polyisoprenoid-binding protein YceI